MKYLSLIFIITIALFSCTKDEPNANIKKDEPNANIKKDVEINLSFSIYDCDCNGVDLPTVEIIGDSRYIYNPGDIPNDIKSQTDWQNKEYIATLKIKDETCECEIGVDPKPGGKPPPKEDLKKVDIINIQKK